MQTHTDLKCHGKPREGLVADRIAGHFETWDEYGFGVIRGTDGKSYFAHYTNFVEHQQRRATISVELGQEASFVPFVDTGHGGRDSAKDIEYDSRSALFRFAYFPQYEAAVEELAGLAVPERWSSSTFDAVAEEKLVSELAADTALTEERRRRRLRRAKFAVLFSFLERTFERLKLENKVVTSDDAAAFNSGLGNKYDLDIYLLFRKERGKDSYVFEKFADANEIGKRLHAVPEPADYFFDVTNGCTVPTDNFLFDTRLGIYCDFTHLFEERLDRFPEEWKTKDDPELFRVMFDALLSRSRNRVRRNHRTAIPFYYPTRRRIQLLLPLTFNPNTAKQSVLALVVSREAAGYVVETIMPTDWAYRNARLVARPDREDWLDF